MKITNNLELPQPLVDAVTREHKYKDKQYSVTSIIKGTCQSVLERRHDSEVEQDVSEMAWLIFGTAVHKILEDSKETNDQLKEGYITVDINDGYKLSGIFDLYDEKHKKVTDYKTGTAWKVIYDEWNDYKQQLLIYAWMLKKIGFECDNAEIVMFLKDWSKTKAQVDSNYPPYPIYTKKFYFSDDDFNEIESFIFKKFEEIKKAESLSDDELEPCTEVERWHKDDTYAVMKKGRKSAVKLFKSEEEANDYLQDLDKQHYLEFREGTDSRCTDYCLVNKFCPFYKKKYEANR